jgi:hypothetical protein
MMLALSQVSVPEKCLWGYVGKILHIFRDWMARDVSLCFDMIASPALQSECRQLKSTYL